MASVTLTAAKTNDRLNRESAVIDRASTERLARAMQQIDEALKQAEKASRGTLATVGTDAPSGTDFSSRLVELERRERELAERTRALEQYRHALERTSEQLRRGRSSLKRAIAKFRSHAEQQSAILDKRSRDVTKAHFELIESRRALAREHIQIKSASRAALRNKSSSFAETA